MADKLTILKTRGPVLTKTYKSDGTTEPYGDAASFDFEVREVASLKALARLLGELHKRPRRCLIAGAPLADPSKMAPGQSEGSIARTNANFTDQPLHSFVIDIDGYEPGFADPVHEPELAVLDFINDHLPECFKTASFYWHLSSSAGMPGKERILKCHVWLWSKTAYTCAQFKAWAENEIGRAIDRAVYRRVQCRYTADPIFEEGRIDPVPVRCGWHQGETDYVDLVIRDDVLADARSAGAGSGSGDMKLADPSSKEGLIGAFHRAFDAERVLLDFLEGEFEQATERRYTWLNGGGTPEGVWVHEDGMHVHANHNTWPCDSIVNLWDLVRIFKFGSLDIAGEDADDFDRLNIEQMPVGRRPSDVAMRRWAEGLPELQAAVREERAERINSFREMISAATSFSQLEVEVAAAIREAELSATERELLASAFNHRVGQVAQARLPIRQVRELLSPEQTPVADRERPEWFKHWVWICEKDAFFNVRTKLVVKERSFNALYDREMHPYANEQGTIPSASALCLQVWDMPVVDRIRYAPQLSLFFKEGGVNYVNSYRPDTVPLIPEGSLTSGQRRAVETVLRHAELLLPDERERNLFLDYLAFCVQNPGVKIRWAPLLKGVEGDGKSVFITLMQHVMGYQNVRVLDSSTLESSDFTAWRVGQCFTGVEEMKLHGHNRYDVYNKLKTALSNDFVDVHCKSKDPVTEPNTTNYLLLTNFEDGVPVTDNDRRLMVSRSPFMVKEELFAEIKARYGMSTTEYFDQLFDQSIKPHAGALRKWLLERELSAEFDPNGRAPLTAARETAIDMSRRDDEDAIVSLLADGGFGIYPNLIALSCFNDALFDRYGIKLQTSRAKAELSQHGFRMWGKGQIKWHGRNYRFYYRGDRPDNPALEADIAEKARQDALVEADFED